MWLLVSAALASPQFVAERPVDVEVAQAAWTAAAACTGREAAAHPEVRIDRTLGPEGQNGRSFVDEVGLLRIELTEHAPPIALARELAHAWGPTGPSAIVEGRAGLLADCVAAAIPKLVPHVADDRGGLAEMPDLREWTLDAGARKNPASSAAVLGSARLFRLIAQVVPKERVWDVAVTDWAAVEALLSGAGDGGARVQAAIAGGAETQRIALGDEDLDALPRLAEELTGLDPARWDTDGDGWWDGAPTERGARARPLPRDGTPVCVGWRASGDTPMKVRIASQLRGADGNATIDHTAADSAIISRTELLASYPGGFWVEALGEGLVEETRCRSDHRYTVRSEDKALDSHVKAFAEALDVVLGRSDALIGPASMRVVVRLGGQGLFVESNAVGTWSVRVGNEHLTGGVDYDTLAATAVALHRTRLAPSSVVRNPAAAGALARVLADKPPARPPVDAFPGEIGKFGKQAEKCPGGWPAMLENGCAPD